jgi:hypothetical protein
MLWNGCSFFGTAILHIWTAIPHTWMAIQKFEQSHSTVWTERWTVPTQKFERSVERPFKNLNGAHSEVWTECWTVVRSKWWTAIQTFERSVWTVVRSKWWTAIQKFERSHSTVWTERWTVPIQKFERSAERLFKNLNGVHSIVWTERWTRLWATHSKTLNGQLFETFQSGCRHSERHSGKWIDRHLLETWMDRFQSWMEITLETDGPLLGLITEHSQALWRSEWSAFRVKWESFREWIDRFRVWTGNILRVNGPLFRVEWTAFWVNMETFREQLGPL